MKPMTVIRGFAVVPLLFAAGALCSAQPRDPLRAATADTFVVMERLASKKSRGPEILRTLDAAARDFDRQLDAVALALTPAAAAQAIAHESDSIEAKLAAIAADRRARPAVYAEIVGTYVTPATASQSGRPPAPKRAHEAEAFRLAWEYALLRPHSSDAAPFYEDGAAEAIARIGNPKSIVTLLHAMRVATQPEARADLSSERQRIALRGLTGIPTAESAAAIGQSLRMIETRKPPAHREWNPRQYAVMRIDELPLPKRLQWRGVAQRMQTAAPETRRFLDQLQTRLRPEVK